MTADYATLVNALFRPILIERVRRLHSDHSYNVPSQILKLVRVKPINSNDQSRKALVEILSTYNSDYNEDSITVCLQVASFIESHSENLTEGEIRGILTNIDSLTSKWAREDVNTQELRAPRAFRKNFKVMHLDYIVQFLLSEKQRLPASQTSDQKTPQRQATSQVMEPTLQSIIATLNSIINDVILISKEYESIGSLCIELTANDIGRIDVIGLMMQMTVMLKYYIKTQSVTSEQQETIGRCMPLCIDYAKTVDVNNQKVMNELTAIINSLGQECSANTVDMNNQQTKNASTPIKQFFHRRAVCTATRLSCQERYSEITTPSLVQPLLGSWVG